MEAVLRSNRGFDDDDDDDDEAAAALREQREGSSQSQKLGDLSVRVDGKSGCRDQQPSTPRSKHSATEQRRRSKINDRFQILRELIPHSDQKRDKASFLLEVIEYIRFLHEKVQKYESAYPEWNQDNTTRLMPWDKVYYRSIWKNAQNNSQGLGDVVGDPPQATGNGASPPGFLYSGKPDETSIPVAPLHSNAQNPTESDNMSGGVPYREMENPSAFASKESTMPVCSQPNLCVSVERETGITPAHHTLTLDADNIASQSQSQCLRSSGIDDCTAGSEMLNDQELTIDEGTISVSTVYSQGLLTTLTQALQSSGVDLSQASISVQISLGKRASSKRPTCITTVSSEKDHDDPSSSNRAIEQSRVGSSGEESEQGPKRQKSDSS